MILMTPWLDIKLRARMHWAYLGAMLALSTLLFVPVFFVPEMSFVNFIPVTWVPCFATGMMLNHRFRSIPNSERNTKLWAVITDATTLAFVAIVAAIVLEGSTENYAEFRKHNTNTQGGNGHGRVGNAVSVAVGFFRLGTPLVALWLYGIAVGRGVTAWALSNKFLVTVCAPLSYLLYLLHTTVAMAFYLALGETRDGDVADTFPGPPVAVPWWCLPVSVIISLILARAFNEFVNPYLMPPMLKYWTLLYNKLYARCCGCELVTVENVGGVGTVENRVAMMLRRLTGAAVGSGDKLTEIGLDSMGLTALSGALRAAFPDLCADLRPTTLNQLETVNDIVLHVTHALPVDT
eukprot:PhM_4_TR14046/c0_g1_i1/m.6308